jgi:D-3-phosphoglycerate dehydrogenase / 2-oxoglutarate reductase
MALLKAQLECEFSRSKDLRPTPAELKEIQGLLIRSRTKVDKQLLDQAPSLKWIATATSGFDHIDFRECDKRGITVSHTPDANVQSAAELTIALILNLSRKVPLALQAVAKNQWRGDELRGFSLKDKTLGLVGLGRVGQQVAKTLKTLGMKIVGADPYVDDAVFTQLGATRMAFTELLVVADFVSFHVPLTKETMNMIGYPTIRLMNPDAYLINTSRGAVVDENEVIVALDEGLIKGAALDVFEREPLTNQSRLRGRDNALLTPHVGAFTEEAIESASLAAVDRTIEFFRTGKAKDTLPLKVGWFSLVL